MTIDELLAKGQSILAERRAKVAAEEAEENRLADAEWQKARAAAKAIAEPLAIIPILRPEHLTRYQLDKISVAFEARPFGDDAGEIIIRVGTVKDEWRSCPKFDNRPFEVGESWVVKHGDDGHYIKTEFSSCATLAEAVALCWERSEDYLKAVYDLEQMKKPKLSDILKRQPPSAAQLLLDALSAWHSSLHHDGDE